MHKLMNGEIDMMGDVSYTEERAESLLYPSLPMGSEDYYFFVRPGDSEFSNKSLFRFSEHASCAVRFFARCSQNRRQYFV